MGYRSTVKLLMGKEAFKMLKEHIDSCSNKYARTMLDEKDGNDIKHREDESVLITWSYVKWYGNLVDVCEVNYILRKLDDEEGEEKYCDELDKYFYKLIQIGEDGRITEETNDEDEEYTSDFYAISDFSL